MQVVSNGNIKNDYLCVAINIFIYNKIVLSGNKYIFVVLS